MDDIVLHRAGDSPDGDTRGAGGTDVFVRLLFAPRGVVVFPFLFVVYADTRDGEAVQHGVLCQQDSGPLFLFAAVDDRSFGPFQSVFSPTLVSGTFERNTWFQPQALVVGSGSDQDSVSRLGGIDGGLNRLKLFGYG
jgi:hypothetical protein